MRASRRAWCILGLAACLALAGAWLHRPILARIYARGLAWAGGDDRDRWVSRMVALDESALPPLLSWLESPQTSVCVNVETALLALVERWSDREQPSLRLGRELHAALPRVSPAGQRTVLHVSAALLQPKQVAAEQVRGAAALLQFAEQDLALRPSALILAGALAAHVPSGPGREHCCALLLQGLGADDVAIRTAAVQALCGEGLRQEQGLLAKVVPLLRDRAAVIRRAALVALAPARELVSEDALLPLLHDSDAEVQRICEVALQSRGLDENHLRLARLISDEDPAARLRVLQHLGRHADLDLSVWLRRLSHDRAAAVRAAAVRASGRYAEVDLSDRLREMAAGDPSETVRQNAQHYLKQKEGERATSGP